MEDSSGTLPTEDPFKTSDQVLESVLKRDRIVVLSALGLVVAASWAYILSGAGMGMSAFDMTAKPSGMGAMTMMKPAVWDFSYAVLMFFMWWIMMIAMMLPSAAPMILLFATINRKQRETAKPFVPTLVFASAYLLVWAGFSVIAVAAQWGLQSAALLSPMMESTSAVLGGSLLLAAGIYQMTPLKQACLIHCRSPLQFIFTRWRNGTKGAFIMGIEHGTYCVGCCWFLMGLLFFGGVMNLYWIAGLAAYVFLEKTIPVGHWFGYVVGGGLVVWGAVILMSAL